MLELDGAEGPFNSRAHSVQAGAPLEKRMRRILLDSSRIRFTDLDGHSGHAHAGGDISRFFPQIDLIFSGEALNPFFGAQDEGFSEFCCT